MTTGDIGLVLNVNTPPQRCDDTASEVGGGGGGGGEIGRLRHFKSPDDDRDDGCRLLLYETRATFGFSSSVCVSKGRQKQKAKQKRKLH